jgi:hypothetical protein
VSRLRWLWHRYVLKHEVERKGAILPDRRIGGINVYEQEVFRVPMAHWECSCGETWF